MNLKFKISIGSFLLFLLLGAGCAMGPQAEIKSPELGKADAPVEIVEWFDFQCGACKYSNSTIVPFVIEDYVDTGKARLVFKNMAFMGENSQRAAVASLCAAEQGKFKEYADKVFENQGAEEGKSDYSADNLKKFAFELGLDTQKFNRCLDGMKYQSQIKKELAEAGDKGIDATPTYFINGQKFLGGTYLAIKRVIDKKLEEMGK